MVVLPLYIPHFSCSYRILKGAVPIPSYIRHPLVKIRVEVRFLLFHYLADETSTTKTTPPLIMLPECAVKTSNTSFTQLAGYLTENATFLSECLDQIRHVSQCHQLESDCSYPLCVNLKKYVDQATNNAVRYIENSVNVVFILVFVQMITVSAASTSVLLFSYTASLAKMINVRLTFVLYI